MSVINSANDFLKPRKRVVEEVEIDGFGTVRIQELTKSQLNGYQKWLRPNGELDNDRFTKRDQALIVLAVVKADGEPMFTMEDIDKIGELPGQAMDALAYEIMLLNGYVEPNETDLVGKSDS